VDEKSGCRSGYGWQSATGKEETPRFWCYHAQQAAEKYFKALLIAQGIEFPKTHDLLILNQLCVSHGILTAFDEDSLDFLSAFAIRVRYPGSRTRHRRSAKGNCNRQNCAQVCSPGAGVEVNRFCRRRFG
jgi:hypothetical protein